MTILVIVESPAKCSKIQSYLGNDYKVMSSMGHIRALKQDLEAVGINNEWIPQYENMPSKSKTIRDLKESAKTASQVILATDDDREGEGIAYHICALLKLDPRTCSRIVFHSITKQAIQDAVNNPKTIDINKFHSQQTRAMLDMMIGYTMSPVLWKQLNSNGLALSAGRCQTPALKLVLDRDLEIENHSAKCFWSFTALFTVANLEPIEANCEKLDSINETSIYLQQICKDQESTLKSVKESVRSQNAPKPLITSTLQQEASKSFHLNPKATMAAAQKLYEAGHITYMRTDNAYLSPEGAQQCRDAILTRCDKAYLGPDGQHQQPDGQQLDSQQLDSQQPDSQQTKKTKSKKSKAPKSNEQAAHEAIRPTHPEIDTVSDLGPMEEKVYRLIWQRALQSQMATSTEDVRMLSFIIACDQMKKLWTSEQVKSKFLGWKLLSQSEKSETNQQKNIDLWSKWSKVAQLATGKWLSIVAEEAYTKACSRYTEASLIHDLETKGIGRPSTFASLVSTIIDRNYVEKSDSAGTQLDVRKWTVIPNKWPPREQKTHQTVGKESNKLQTTVLGRTVAEFLYKHYDDLFAYTYTAQMEQNLDNVAKGTHSWKALLQSSWDLYKDRYINHITNVLDPESKKAKQKRILGEDIVVVLSKKGPLLLKEATKDFASLPQGTSFETVTLEQAKSAYALKLGETMGQYEDKPLLKKKGPYGFYVQWTTINVPCKPDDTIESLIEKIKKKQMPEEKPYERKIGDYTIKKGPYGLYFFKHTLKKANFVSFPQNLDPDKITAQEVPQIYQLAIKSKSKKPKN